MLSNRWGLGPAGSRDFLTEVFKFTEWEKGER